MAVRRHPTRSPPGRRGPTARCCNRHGPCRSYRAHCPYLAHQPDPCATPPPSPPPQHLHAGLLVSPRPVRPPPTRGVADKGAATQAPPTVVLVHGAFADSTSWNDVIRKLRHDRYPVVTVANPLRSLTGDATYLKEVLAGIDDPSSWPDTRTAAR
ncbi:hypothetical protein [Streptomyces sp. KL116D]|uniref:hypothetical protein n=1 Tax=Streptomyces sp. KL116D TaxID=3045152 RepID=UPI003558D458